ncbi:NADH dehydrogenase 1, alpha/beta subcomplex subunit 1 ndufab1/ACP [Dinochytrium kinnereticum]|nr:NADH dehydrogenase 1, alpha/beta subcomplex subunit 1 ndufab1/ACP [Dinochytrium kinnereticum]
MSAVRNSPAMRAFPSLIRSAKASASKRTVTTVASASQRVALRFNLFPALSSSIASPSFPRSNVVGLSVYRSYSAGPEPLTIPGIEKRVMELLSDFEKVDVAKLTLDSHFITDLGLDSLDQVEITMALEDEFNIEIPDRDADEIMTPRQAVQKIFANKNAM